MNQVRIVALQTRSVSAGMLWLLGTAIALTQLTSLALGPAASRQLNVAIAVPAVDLEDVSSSIGSQVDAVLGAVVTAGPVGAHETLVASRSTSLPDRRSGVRSVPVPAATIFVSSTPVVTTSEPSQMAGHSGHDDHGHERGSAKGRRL
jgi:hypothetical protein